MERNVHWHSGEVTRAQRNHLLRQRGATLWFTGLSGCGKSTLSVALESLLLERQHLAYRLDGDNLRFGINSDLGFSLEDRRENIRRVGEIAKLMADSGIIVICSLISPYREDRDIIRALHLANGLPFYEIFLDCPLEVAELRDPKGLYQKARAGLIANFTGINDPYEPPENPEIHLDTERLQVREEVGLIVSRLEEDGIFP